MVRQVRDRKGQALAEFAIVLPVVFLLIAGIIEFGRAWNIKAAVTDAAREGARYTVIVDARTTTQVQNLVKQRLALANIDTTNPPTTVTITPTAFWKCPAGVAGASGAQMTVQVTTTYHMSWVGAMMRWVGGTSNIPINSQATMRNEC